MQLYCNLISALIRSRFGKKVCQMNANVILLSLFQKPKTTSSCLPSPLSRPPTAERMWQCSHADPWPTSFRASRSRTTSLTPWPTLPAWALTWGTARGKLMNPWLQPPSQTTGTEPGQVTAQQLCSAAFSVCFWHLQCWCKIPLTPVDLTPLATSGRSEVRVIEEWAGIQWLAQRYFSRADVCHCGILNQGCVASCRASC